jgi:hypothetical protein
MATNDRCAHCNSPIIDRSTVVERAGKTFCCRNCEAAMAQQKTPGDPTYMKEPE